MAEEKQHTPADLWNSLGQILLLGRPYWGRLAVGMLLTTLAMAVWLTIPLGLKELLDAVFKEGDRDLLNFMAAGMLLLFVIQSALSFGSHYLVEWVGERVVVDFRKRVYAHLHRLGLAFFSDQRLGELTSRLTNDVGAIRTAAVEALMEVLRQGFFMLGSVSVMVWLNWRLSLIIFLAIPGAAYGSRKLGMRIRELSRDVQDRLADSTSIAEEALSAIRVVKAFARGEYETRRYNDAIEALFKTARHRTLITALYSAIIGFLFLFALVLIFWYGGSEVLDGRLSAGDLVAFIFYAFNIARAVMGLSRLYSTLNRAAGATERLFELLDTKPDIQDAPGAIDLPDAIGRVVFDHVSFSYRSDVPVLVDVSFEVEAGSTVAIVGPSGAGKSTLIHLIPRFYDPASGRVTVDGQGLREVRVLSLREQMGLVAQDVHLFGSSVRENIRYGRLEATDEEIEAAARAANAHAFISGFPEGYDSLVGEKGVKLSGGQRQRVSIARAILKDPRILLLDEATSSLDSESEAAIQDALVGLMKDRTTFIIAHRLATVQHATQILVLDEGRIVESGRHEALYSQGGLYRRLCELQFREAVR
jgi:ATP-binding cassette, subfamily B, bacterial MsbA